MEIMDDNPLIIYVKEKELAKTYKHVLLQKLLDIDDINEVEKRS